MVDALLPTRNGLKKLASLHAYKNWYTVCVKDGRSWFEAFQNHTIRSQAFLHSTFIRSQNVRGVEESKVRDARKLSSTSFDAGEAIQQNPMRCDAEEWKVVLGGGLGRNVDWLQIYLQHNADKKSFILTTGESVLVTPTNCSG